MDAVLSGVTRDPALGVAGVGTGVIRRLHQTEQGELIVAAGKAPFTEISRLGRMFQVTNTTTIAAVVAIPTTAVMLALYNNEPEAGRSYVIDYVSAVNLVSTTLIAAQASLVINVGQVREAVPTTAAPVQKKTNGLGGSGDSRARTIISGTALPSTTGAAGFWIPVGQSAAKFGLDVTPGYGLYWDAQGRVIVPPGRYFAMHVVANIVTETFRACIGWHEVQLTLG
jgi:hypothetical protein